MHVAVFVRYAVKACHLEVLTKLSTAAFLAAFDRFVALRGVPSNIFTDCSTNFVGADRQLNAIINSPEGQVTLDDSRPHWTCHFKPPSAPHFEDFREAAVRSMKRLLARVMGNH
jgi:hypothetical protein